MSNADRPLTARTMGVTLVSLYEASAVSTTSLKLSPELKKRVAAVAAERGVTAHAFMVEAIEASARAAELRAGFVADAVDARSSLYRTGKGYDAESVHRYIRDRANGKKVRRPRVVSWRD